MLRLSTLDCWSKIKNSVLLVTGVTGFIGYYVVKSLLLMNRELNLNNEIVVHGRSLTKIVKALDDDFFDDNLKIMLGDISREIIVSCKIDYVIHAAMPSESATLKKAPVKAFEAAVLGTKNVIEVCKRTAVKSMVYLSTVTIYGNIAKKG